MSTFSEADSFDGVPPYMIALWRMLDDPDHAVHFASSLDASSFPDRESRDLYKYLSVEGPKGPSIFTLRPAVEQNAPHCLALFRELVDSGAILRDECSNEYLAERVTDDGKRTRLERSAKQTLTELASGKPTADILAKADMQRAAIDLANEKNRGRFLLRDDVEIQNAPQPEHLIEGFLPLGVLAVAVGPPASVKSLTALDWASHIQVGLDWCGRRTLVGQTVYLAGEGGGGINKRMAAWRAQNNYTGLVGVHFLTNPLTLNDPADLAGLVKAIQSKGIAPKLVVIDTLSRYLLGNENAAEDMGAFVRGCDELRRIFGCTVLVIHHSGKDATKGARGSSVLQGAADVEILFDRPEGEMSVTLSSGKPLRDGSPLRPITLEVVEIAGSVALKSSGPTRERLDGKRLDSLLMVHENDAGEGITHGAWRDFDCGEEKSKFSGFNKRVKWLKAEGYVNLAKGQYRVSDAGRLSIRSTQSTTSPSLVHSVSSVSPLTSGYIGTHVEDQTRELDLEAAVA